MSGLQMITMVHLFEYFEEVGVMKNKRSNIASVTDDNFITDSGALVVRIAKTCNSKNALLEFLKIELKFPEDYAINWDAFNEAINDLSWISEKTIMLIHEQFPQLPDKDFTDYIDILRGAVEEWKTDGSKKLIVVFG